jgi:hypothetical protein
MVSLATGCSPDRSVPITGFSNGRRLPFSVGRRRRVTALNSYSCLGARSTHESTVGSVSKAAHAVADGRGGAFNARPAGKRRGCKIVGLWPAIGR